MRHYAIVESNTVINLIIAGHNFIPPDSSYVPADHTVTVGDAHIDGQFIKKIEPIKSQLPILSFDEIDAILRTLEDEKPN